MRIPDGMIYIYKPRKYQIDLESKELIMCKHCKHWYNDADTGMACEFTNMSQPEDGYCNWAASIYEGVEREEE